MMGEISVRIRNNKNEYHFVLRRNITVLRGESGTGKTTLYRMVSSYSREGKTSGIHASTTNNVPLCVLEGNFWQDEMRKIQNSVVLIDEDSNFINSREFARLISKSSNYYLLITRSYLPEIPYSVDEIYQIKGKKKKTFEAVYRAEERIYAEPHIPALPFYPDMVITEDSGSGYQFFKKICSENGIDCISARGKSNVIKCVRKYQDHNLAVIADGAAFGTEIEDLAEIQIHSDQKLAFFLPESFEWLILRSGVVINPDVPELNYPSKYVDSSKYVSWERYFNRLLTEHAERNQFGHYNKRKLDDWYLQDEIQQKICDAIAGLNFKK